MKDSSTASVALAKKELKRRRRRADAAMSSFLQLIDVLRQNAKNNGYALAVHGSLLRDIDLIAVPWINRPKAPSTLHKSLFKLAKVLYKYAYTAKKPTLKPQGRVAWVIHLGNGTYIDLSVMSPKRGTS